MNLGVKDAGLVQVVTTSRRSGRSSRSRPSGILGRLADFETINQRRAFPGALAPAPLTMFAFLGIELATVPAGDVIDPQRTIPRATLIGTAVSALIYLFGTAVVMGVIPRES